MCARFYISRVGLHTARLVSVDDTTSEIEGNDSRADVSAATRRHVPLKNIIDF